MGQVFKARHRTLGRIVALKVLRKQMLKNTVAVRRFRREVQAIAQMAHPNIVRALDADEVGGSLHLAMEYVEGQDLAGLIRETGPLRLAQACDYIRQAALGLQHAHECGLVHRDIKPANLMVTREKGPGSTGLLTRAGSCLGRWGTVKILDLGLARLQERDDVPGVSLLTKIGSVMGTPDFIAPEQVRDSHDCDIRADLYSLGCTLYFLLCGQVPFPNGTITQRLLQHQLDEPEPVEDVRRQRLLSDTGATRGPGFSVEIPAAVRDLVRKLMAKNPQERPQTAAELAETLTEILRKARPSTLIRRRPTRAALAQRAASLTPVATGAAAAARQPPAGVQEPATLLSHSAPSVEAPPLIQPRPRRVGRRLKGTRKVCAYSGFLLVCVLAGRLVLPGAPATAADPPAPSRASRPGPAKDDGNHGPDSSVRARHVASAKR
jgi:serine/threonine-protein kinase